MLSDLPAAPLAAPELVVQAPWGSEIGAFGRELDGSDLGPMAIAADPEGGVALLDTVNGRVVRFGDDGSRNETIELGLQTADDLVLRDDGSLAVLVYQRLPSPRHEIRVRSRSGEWAAPLAVPQAASLPTGLLAEGSRLYVEQRHGWLLGMENEPRIWGRPAGRLLLRALRDGDGSVVIEARDRTDQAAWRYRLVCPWPVTEVLALETSTTHLALVIRHVDNESEAAPNETGHQTWMVSLRPDGSVLGTTQLVDRRITDAGRPVALSNDGDVYELRTDEAGVSVLRYRFGGAR